MKIDVTVKRETRFVACGVIALSLLMQAVFLLIGKWSLAVLWGNLYSAVIATLNFFLMGVTVQKALADDPDAAQKRMKASQSYRLFGMAVLLAVAVYFGVEFGTFNVVALIVPQFFVRITVFVRGLMLSRGKGAQAPDPDGQEDKL